MIFELLKRLQGWFLGEAPSRLEHPRRGVPSNVGIPSGGVAAPSRTLEELRADLARLRASSKERHAPVPVERPLSFDESVFADFQTPAAPQSADRNEYPRTVLAARPSHHPENLARADIGSERANRPPRTGAMSHKK